MDNPTSYGKTYEMHEKRFSNFIIVANKEENKIEITVSYLGYSISFPLEYMLDFIKSMKEIGY